MTIPDLDPDAFPDALQAPLVLVEFWAPWCPYSALMHPRIEAVARTHGDDVDVARVNVDAHPDLADALGVEAVPSAVLFRTGEPVETWLGTPPTRLLHQGVDTHAGSALAAS